MALEPEGWQALRIVTTRLSYIIAQSQRKKRLRERDFDVRIGGNIQSPETEKAQWEALSVRQEIAADLEEQSHG